VTLPKTEPSLLIGGRVRADSRPLYLQAEEALRRLLESGQYPPGRQLPTEPELAQQLGISRSTLREAMRAFEERGWISRRQGVGTFVRQLPAHPPVIESGLEVLESIDQIARRMGLQTHMGEALVEERLATSAELVGLGLETASTVLSVARTILVEAQPVAYLQDSLPLTYLRQADLRDGFSGSVLDFLLRRGHPRLAYSYTRLTATAADAGLARLLHVTRGTPLLKMEAQLYSTEDHIVDYSISYFVPGTIDFHVVRRVARRAERTG